jgi:thiol:disulfide interchange protein
MIQIVRAALGLVFLAAAAVFVLGIANGFGPLELALIAGLAVAALVAFGRLGERRAGPLRTPR